MRRLVKKSHAIVLLVGVICFTIAAAQAPDAAHMSAMGRIVQGQVPFAEHVADHAAAIRSTSKMIPRFSPRGAVRVRPGRSPTSGRSGVSSSRQH